MLKYLDRDLTIYRPPDPYDLIEGDAEYNMIPIVEDNEKTEIDIIEVKEFGIHVEPQQVIFGGVDHQ
jgi:chaperone required for assembly of F1-ATPase